jgi:hypothetical protein
MMTKNEFSSFLFQNVEGRAIEKGAVGLNLQHPDYFKTNPGIIVATTRF